MSHEYECYLSSVCCFKCLIASILVSCFYECLCYSLLILIGVKERLSIVYSEFSGVLIDLFLEFVILCTAHKVSGLYDHFFNACCYSLVHSLFYVIDSLAVSCPNVVDDDLSCECSSYCVFIAISFFKSFFNSADGCYTAVVEGSTEAYYE